MIYNRRQINESEDEERQDLLVDYENDRYILLLPLKVSNRLLNLGEGTKNLVHLVSKEL